MSGKRSRARKPRARRAGRAQQATGRQGPEAEPPPPAAGGLQDEVGVAPSEHVTSSKPAPQGHPKVTRPEQPQAAKRPVQAAALGSEMVLVPASDMEGCGAGDLMPGLGPELLRLHEVQLCLAQEQLLLEDRRRQVQLQMQLWQEEQLWQEQLWQEEQLWLQQLQEEQAWVRVEGLELAMALEQLRSEGLEVLQTQGQVSPGRHGRGQSLDNLWGCGGYVSNLLVPAEDQKPGRLRAVARLAAGHLWDHFHICKVRLVPTIQGTAKTMRQPAVSGWPNAWQVEGAQGGSLFRETEAEVFL